jgi:hypothetical protein
MQSKDIECNPHSIKNIIIEKLNFNKCMFKMRTRSDTSMRYTILDQKVSIIEEQNA